jgi:threonine synthase
VTADRAPRDFCDFLHIYIILPTGAMGNIVAGYNMVKKMGIPLGILYSG